MTECKMMAKVTPSPMDVEHLAIIRESVRDFMKYIARQYATNEGKLLDIAPQDHEGARPYMQEFIIVETLDINPEAGCTGSAMRLSRTG